MSLQFDYQVLGLKELNAQLDQLPIDIARKDLEAAARAGAAPIAKAAKSKCRVATEIHIQKRKDTITFHKPGDLKKSISSKKNKAGGLAVTYDIAPSRRAFWGIFEEFGTRYQSPHPFMRPAFDETYEESLLRFIARLKQGTLRDLGAK